VGDSRFYWSPMLADGAVNVGVDFDEDELETITIPRGSTLCDYDPTGEPALSLGAVQLSTSSVNARGGTVRIRAALGNDSDLAEALHAMVSFARAGGCVGFALDIDQVWAVQIEDDLLSDATDFDYPTSFVEGWENITDPESGWRCHVQSALPQGRRERVVLDTVAAGNATLVENLVFAYSAGNWNVLVRPKHFYPFLTYVSGDVAVRDGGGWYVFDCTFEVDVGLEHTPIEVAEFAEIVTGESSVYLLLLLMDGGDGSTTYTDDGINGYTITYFTNDGVNGTEQTNDQVLFGVTSAEFYRGGGTPGHGGMDVNLQWTAGTGMDFGADPDILIGCAIWPTYTSGDDDHCILMLRRSVPQNWKLWYEDDGTVRFTSLEGAVAQCDLTSSIPLVYGEWNWIFVSMHDGTTTLWVGTDASGIVTNAASDADTSSYNMGSLGTTSASVSIDPISSGGRMNSYVDHLYVREGAWIDDSNGATTMQVPTAQPVP